MVDLPLLVVAAVPGGLPGRGAVRGRAPAVGDHGVGAVHDAVVAAAGFDELPLQVVAAVPGPLLEVRAGGDVAAAVDDQSVGHIGSDARSGTVRTSPAPTRSRRCCRGPQVGVVGGEGPAGAGEVVVGVADDLVSRGHPQRRGGAQADARRLQLRRGVVADRERSARAAVVHVGAEHGRSGNRRRVASPGRCGRPTRASHDIGLRLGDRNGAAAGGVDHLEGAGEDLSADVDSAGAVGANEDLAACHQLHPMSTV